MAKEQLPLSTSPRRAAAAMGAAPLPTAHGGRPKRRSRVQALPLKPADTSSPPCPASATHTSVLFCGSTAAGAEMLSAPAKGA